MQQPADFADNDVVKAALRKDGNDCLPLTLVDGTVVCKGKYPTRDELAGYGGIEVSPSLFTDSVKELVAIGEAIGSHQYAGLFCQREALRCPCLSEPSWL